MNFEIREALPRDCEAIHKLNCAEMGYDFPADQTAIKLNLAIESTADRVYVAVVDGAVVGYVHANDYDLLYAPHMKNIMGIAVSSEYGNRGIGRALLERVEKWARESGACAVRLVSGANRVGAHEFYRKCGYGGDKMQINFKKELSSL